MSGRRGGQVVALEGLVTAHLLIGDTGPLAHTGQSALASLRWPVSVGQSSRALQALEAELQSVDCVCAGPPAGGAPTSSPTSKWAPETEGGAIWAPLEGHFGRAGALIGLAWRPAGPRAARLEAAPVIPIELETSLGLAWRSGALGSLTCPAGLWPARQWPAFMGREFIVGSLLT